MEVFESTDGVVDQSCDGRIIRRFAGSFVLVSLALGVWVNPAWPLFTVFVGVNPPRSSFTTFCPP